MSFLENAVRSSCNDHLYLSISMERELVKLAVPIIITHETVNLKLPEVLRVSVTGHENIHFESGRNTIAKRKLLIEAMRRDLNGSVDRTFVERYNENLRFIWEILAHYGQIRLFNTPLDLVSGILDTWRGSEFLDTLMKLDELATTIVSKTRTIETRNPHIEICDLINAGIRTLERRGESYERILEHFMNLLSITEEFDFEFDSSESWEVFFKSRFAGEMEVGVKEYVVDNIGFFKKSGELISSDSSGSLARYVFGYLEEFGLVTPIVLYVADDLESPSEIRIDGCFIPKPGSSYLLDNLQTSEGILKREVVEDRRADDYINFLKELVRIQDIIYRCRETCFGKEVCKLKLSVYRHVRDMLLSASF